jgi:hypothetical protein
MSLSLGILAIIFLIFYLIGCLMHLWEYNIIDVIFNPIAGAIVIILPLSALMITLRFINCYQTRRLFYKIVKAHRRSIEFIIMKDTGGNPDNEITFTLWGKYRRSSFRFAYSMGHPLTISLITDMKNNDVFRMNRILKRLKLKNRSFNSYGLTVELKKPFTENNISGITGTLDLLLAEFQKILRESKLSYQPESSVKE